MLISTAPSAPSPNAALVNLGADASQNSTQNRPHPIHDAPSARSQVVGWGNYLEGVTPVGTVSVDRYFSPNSCLMTTRSTHLEVTRWKSFALLG